MHTVFFFQQCLWVFGFLITFGLIGGFTLIPFRHSTPYIFLAAPLTGLCVMALGLSMLCGMMVLNFKVATLIVAALGISTTIGCLIINRPKLNQLSILQTLAIIACIVFITYLTNFVSIKFGQHGFLFMDGSDQTGYTQLADWLLTNSAKFPTLSPQLPYQSWPNFAFVGDPRFGSYYILAFVSFLYGQSGMFTFDLACCVVLLAGCFAVVGVFTRSRLTFFLLLISLLTTFWFDYSRSGYFGKILGFPMTLLLVGLFVNSKKPLNSIAVAMLILMACAIAIIYPGMAIGVMLIILCGIFVLLETIISLSNFRQSRTIYVEYLVLFTALVIITFAANGLLSFPHSPITCLMDTTWASLLPSIIELRIFPAQCDAMLIVQLTLSALILLFITIEAIRKQSHFVLSIIIGPILLLTIFMLAHNKNLYWVAFQLIGIVYPSVLCAMIYLIDDVQLHYVANKTKIILVILMLLFVAFHVPRFLAAIKRYSGSDIQTKQQFLKSDMDKIRSIAKTKPIIVDSPEVTHTLAILSELLKNDLPIAWTPRAWKAILGYRSWSAPKINLTNKVWIIEKNQPAPQRQCNIIFETLQYQLFDCKK